MLHSFSYRTLKNYFEKSLHSGYKIITCKEYAENKKKYSSNSYLHINRVDVDFSLRKMKRLVDLFNKLDIKATFFIRLHCDDYNVLSFENYRIIRKAIDSGHEIGYHSEIMELEKIWKIDPKKALIKDIKLLENYFNINISGVASHGGISEINNLDFWNHNIASDFNLLYEAYDNTDEFGLFYNSLYVSDSLWKKWKSYKNGVLISGDDTTLGGYLETKKEKIIYSLIHSDTYYDEHCYE